MKHTTSKILFAYWDAIRGERAAPERRDVQPGGMRHILADTFVLGLAPGQPPIFRLAGTRLTALFCRSLSGVAFARHWQEDDRGRALEILDIAVSETLGAVIGLTGRNENGSELPLELLLLPLRHRGRTNARVLGAMSPASIPSWAGLVPLATLEIRSARMIEAARSRAETDDQGPRAGRRALLTVHEGGLA